MYIQRADLFVPQSTHCADHNSTSCSISAQTATHAPRSPSALTISRASHARKHHLIMLPPLRSTQLHHRPFSQFLAFSVPPHPIGSPTPKFLVLSAQATLEGLNNIFAHIDDVLERVAGAAGSEQQGIWRVGVVVEEPVVVVGCKEVVE